MIIFRVTSSLTLCSVVYVFATMTAILIGFVNIQDLQLITLQP
jgi:hypothetical protein